jgi:hypothetical protein
MTGAIMALVRLAKIRNAETGEPFDASLTLVAGDKKVWKLGGKHGVGHTVMVTLLWSRCLMWSRC